MKKQESRGLLFSYCKEMTLKPHGNDQMFYYFLNGDHMISIVKLEMMINISIIATMK